MSANDPNAAKPASQIFDRRRVRAQRTRSASQFADHDFLHRRAMEDIVDRLESATRAFPRALFIGAGDLASMITPRCNIGEIVEMDIASARLPKAASPAMNAIVADEEHSPFAEQSFDLVVSMLTLHSVNDLIGALVQHRRSLNPDGLMVAVLFAENTLGKWRHALRTAEIEQTGALATRTAPFAAIQDLGAALQRAGFALPVTDIDRVAVQYREPMRLIADLRGIGENNPMRAHGAPLRRMVIARALDKFGESGLREEFELVFLTGWAPGPNQQQPLKPGAGKTSMADAVRKHADRQSE